MILLLNGAFGVGKTTVARALARRLPRSVVFDPELVGFVLQRAARVARRDVHDFQDLSAWRRLTVMGVRAAHVLWPNVIVPMAFSKVAYLDEIRAKLGRFDHTVVHVCMVAPVEVVQARLRSRGADPLRHRWQFERAAECCAVHGRPEFATQVPAADRGVNEIAEEMLALLKS